MKEKLAAKLILFTGLLLVMTIPVLPGSPLDEKNENKGTIRIVIKGIDETKGTIKLALCNSEESYSGEAFKKYSIVVDKDSLIIEMNDIPFGKYAFKLFHDVDNNGILNKNFLGIPTEDYAFSNNAKGMFGPASYEDAVFELNKPVIEQQINL